MDRYDIYFEALRTRDPRFDGKFFVGVKTTGIYCRPICPAKPKRENVEFFSSAIAAERKGYRACLRCRPESAPQSAVWIGSSSIVRRAVKILNSQETLKFNEDEFASRFGVSARHLRRLFVEEIGKTPKQLAFENRLNLSRTLLVDTRLSISEVAMAAGFRSIRRFNDSFRDRFKRSPSQIRRTPLSNPPGGLRISLAYRPPYDFAGLLRNYENHRMGELEWVTSGTWNRIVSFQGKIGQISVSDDPKRSRLLVEINYPDTSVIQTVVMRIRAQFDLDSDPVVVANALERDPKSRRLLRKFPGIRLPSGWDPFEIGIATILGQLVSLERARGLVSDLISLVGQEVPGPGGIGRVRLFPAPEAIFRGNLAKLKTTRRRRETLVEFSRAVFEKRISLEPTQEVERFIHSVSAIRGIGPWTANSMALKVLRHTDAFPGSDLILARALELHTPEAVDRMSPWRGYAASLFWRAYFGKLKKKKAENKNETTVGPKD